MELHQLEAFAAVAEAGSFTRAAEVLFLTQPAVTRQIAALETELKTRLFDRLGRTVRLTASGQVLHEYAETILRLTRDAKEAVGDVTEGRAGRLAVGASSTLATYVLPSLLRAFRATHPQVEIAVHTGVSARIWDMVQAGGCDIGLVTSDADTAPPLLSNPSPLLVTPLADYETCVVVPPQHNLANRKSVHPGDLAGSSLLLMETGTNLRTYVDRLLSAANVAEQTAMELDNVEAIKRMIEADLGISLLPKIAVQAEVASGTLVALPLADVPRAHRRIVLVRRSDKYVSTALRAFVALLEKNVASPEAQPSV